MVLRKFWSTVWCLRTGKQYSVNTIYGNGALLTSTRDIVGRLKEYFEDLVSPTYTSSIKEAESRYFRVDSPFTGSEIAEIVKKLLCGKAPGVDEIRPEILKALDVVGQHRIDIGGR